MFYPFEAASTILRKKNDCITINVKRIFFSQNFVSDRPTLASSR